MFKVLLSFTLFFTCIYDVIALEFHGNIYKTTYEYNRLHQKFSNEVCTKGTDFQYSKKLKAYRGDGKYIPLINNKIDYDAVRGNLELLKKKTAYTQGIYYRLKKSKKLPSYKNVAEALEKNIEYILGIKRKIHLDHKDTLKLKRDLAKEITELKKSFNKFISNIYFLKSFGYPVNHLKNRIDYENSKNRQASNRLYFRRKIFEDGAFDKNNTRPDIYVRSTIDTLKLKINNLKDDLDENTRYDLVWTLANVNSILSRGYSKQLERIKEWSRRADSNLKFYEELLSLKNAKKIEKSLKEKDIATHELRDFVNTKQAQTYKWWMKQSELMRAIYVLETILYNEVGPVDNKDGLERTDVVQIVLNRLGNNDYSKLLSSQDLYAQLKMKRKEVDKYIWLNTLFKKGEFSFTFHYIPSVSKIFCPDMSRIGTKLRNDNIKISLKALKAKRDNFKAVRYFSRVSMLGKIDMSSIWKSFYPLEQRAGFLAPNQNELIAKYKKNKFSYYYSFKDPEGKSFDVININDISYSLYQDKKKFEFHNYRDPNLFTYFIKK